MRHFSCFIPTWLGAQGRQLTALLDIYPVRLQIYPIVLIFAIFMMTACQSEQSDPPQALNDAALYGRHCGACHGPMGEGLGRAVPPLDGSEWLQLPAENFTQLLLRGVAGPIRVKGEEYRSQMPGQSHLSDETLARIASYVRQRWGGIETPISVAQLSAARMQSRAQPALRADQLAGYLPQSK